MSTDAEKILRKVRGLLAQAENGAATPEEAEAFSAKAEELIARYGVDMATLADRGEHRGKPTIRTYPIPSPYGLPKASLLAAIATAHSCKVIRQSDHGQGTLHVIGFESDLDIVDLLYTSLLLQGSHAMLHETRSSKSFRVSFWYGFALRVNQRLEAMRAKVHESVSTSTAVVLRDRSCDVDQAVREAFPRTRNVSGRARNAAGFTSGKSAADRADLGGKRVGHTRAAVQG